MFNLAAEMEIIHFSEDDKSYPSWNDATMFANGLTECWCKTNN